MLVNHCWEVLLGGGNLLWVITIGEIWAVGSRSDDEVYVEMRTRVESLGSNPMSQTLASVVELLGHHADHTFFSPPLNQLTIPCLHG